MKKNKAEGVKLPDSKQTTGLMVQDGGAETSAHIASCKSNKITMYYLTTGPEGHWNPSKKDTQCP